MVSEGRTGGVSAHHYSEFFKRQGKSDKWIAENITPEYAADEVAADYFGELMENDAALRSLQNRPGLVGKIINAIERLAKGKSMVEQSEYRRLANRLREIAGVSENIQEPTRSPAQRVRAGEGATGRGAEDFARMGEIGAVSPVSDVGQAVSGDGVRYSIKYDQNNNPYVVIDNDILMDIPKNEWVKTVKDNLRHKFPNGVVVGNNVVNINKQSRMEMTFSKYMQRLFNTEPKLYSDKLRSTDNADEILKASRNWVNEALMHPRRDDIVDFARGDVMLRIGDKDFSAQVIVGNRGKNGLLLYDIINMTPTSILEQTEKTDAVYTVNAQNEPHSRGPASATNSILNTYEKSNTKFSVEDELTGQGNTGLPKLMWAVNTAGAGQGNRRTAIVPRRTIPKSPFVQYGQDVEGSASKHRNRETAIVPKRTIPKSPFVQYLEDIKDGAPNNIRPQSTEKSSGENVFAEQGSPGYNGIIQPNAEANSGGQRDKRILLGGKLWSEAPDTGEQGRGLSEGAGGDKVPKAIKYSPVNPGPLKEDVAKSFNGASYTEKVLAEDTVMYRVYGGEAGEIGSFFSKTPQGGGLQSQLDLALNPA